MTLQMLYATEPELEAIAKQAAAQKQRPVDDKYRAYVVAKRAAWELVGWSARDPRLRSSEAWDCYFRYILEELKL